jgi:hypothetical protein
MIGTIHHSNNPQAGKSDLDAPLGHRRHPNGSMLSDRNTRNEPSGLPTFPPARPKGSEQQREVGGLIARWDNIADERYI